MRRAWHGASEGSKEAEKRGGGGKSGGEGAAEVARAHRWIKSSSHGGSPLHCQFCHTHHSHSASKMSMPARRLLRSPCAVRLLAQMASSRKLHEIRVLGFFISFCLG